MFIYAVPITEETLDLCEFLNSGVRPMVEDDPTNLVVMVKSPTEITTKIKATADLYDENGHARGNIHFLIG